MQCVNSSITSLHKSISWVFGILNRLTEGSSLSGRQYLLGYSCLLAETHLELPGEVSGKMSAYYTIYS